MLAPTPGSWASPQKAWACCLNCRAGSTRHSHRGTGVLEKPQPTAFPNQLWAVELPGVLASPGVRAAAVGWGVLTAGGRVRAPPGGPVPFRLLPAPKLRSHCPLLCLLSSPHGEGLRLPPDTSHPGPPACEQPRGPICTSSPPPVPSTLKST